MSNRNRKHRTRVLAKEMVSALEWFKEYWSVLITILIAVASVMVYYYWFLGTLPP